MHIDYPRSKNRHFRRRRSVHLVQPDALQLLGRLQECSPATPSFRRESAQQGSLTPILLSTACNTVLAFFDEDERQEPRRASPRRSKRQKQESSPVFCPFSLRNSKSSYQWNVERSWMTSRPCRCLRMPSGLRD